MPNKTTHGNSLDPQTLVRKLRISRSSLSLFLRRATAHVQLLSDLSSEYQQLKSSILLRGWARSRLQTILQSEISDSEDWQFCKFIYGLYECFLENRLTREMLLVSISEGDANALATLDNFDIQVLQQSSIPSDFINFMALDARDIAELDKISAHIQKNKAIILGKYWEIFPERRPDANDSYAAKPSVKRARAIYGA
jgi:hypothetical protein